MPEEDLHLSDLTRSQAHTPPASAAWSFTFALLLTAFLLRKIGVGRDDWFRSPSLRTGQADFPHPALQLVVHLRED
jgi:hypothetical protein